MNSPARILILPFKGLFLFLKWFLSLGFRVIFIVAIVGGIAWGVIAWFDPLGTSEPGETTIPSISEAPYIASTTSRLYYVKEYSQEGDTTVLKGYWELTGRGRGTKWVYRDSLPLTPDFGEVKIQRR